MDGPTTQASGAEQRELALRQLRERIFRYAASRMQREAAEDAAQETMLVLHEKYGHLTEATDLAAVAFQILRFKLQAAGRKAARRGENHQEAVEEAGVPDPGESPEAAAERAEMETRLRAALGRMGERCREIFRMKLLGYSFEEIRRRFGVESINTVYTWDARCRKELLERMGGGWEARR